MNAENHASDPVARSAAIEATAVAWLCERDEGFTPDRAAEFAAWCAADPRHRAAADTVERGLTLLHELPAAREVVAARLPPGRATRLSAVRRERSLGWAWASRLAAAAALVAMVWWRLPLGNSPEVRTFVAENAPVREVLADGSVLNLNRYTRAKAEFDSHERRVALLQGEAHFEVKSDPARPFIVMAGGVAARAVGTMFAVRLGQQAVEVLVEEGRVAVTAASPARTAAVASVPAPLVRAGEHAVMPRQEPAAVPRIAKVDPPTMAAALQWHRRIAVFNDTPLQEVIAQFNRRNPVQISLANEELGTRRFGGVLPLDQVAALLRLLEREGGITVERHGETEIVLRRAP